MMMDMVIETWHHSHGYDNSLVCCCLGWREEDDDGDDDNGTNDDDHDNDHFDSTGNVVPIF